MTLKGEARAVEEVSPDEVNSFISEFIITVREKDDNEDYEPSSMRGMLASFERYLKRKKYGYSIIKDVEFEKARVAFKSKRKKPEEEGQRRKT